MTRSKCIFFSLAANALICAIYIIFILMYRPDVIDLVFSSKNNFFRETEFKYYRKLIMDGEVLLNIDKTKYENVCILSSELNPYDQGKRIYGKDVYFKDAFGALMGWNDNNWHVLLKQNNNIYIISMNSSLFPFLGGMTCSNQIIVAFDKLKKAVIITATGDL